MNKEHSPLPWKITASYPNELLIWNSEGNYIAGAEYPEMRKANAAFAEKAVNNHDKLVEASKELVRLLNLDSSEMEIEFNLGTMPIKSPYYHWCDARDRAVENLDKAIAEAEK
jgi:hypothetical protein